MKRAAASPVSSPSRLQRRRTDKSSSQPGSSPLSQNEETRNEESQNEESPTKVIKNVDYDVSMSQQPVSENALNLDQEPLTEPPTLSAPPLNLLQSSPARPAERRPTMAALEELVGAKNDSEILRKQIHSAQVTSPPIEGAAAAWFGELTRLQEMAGEVCHEKARLAREQHPMESVDFVSLTDHWVRFRNDNALNAGKIFLEALRNVSERLAEETTAKRISKKNIAEGLARLTELRKELAVLKAQGEPSSPEGADVSLNATKERVQELRAQLETCREHLKDSEAQIEYLSGKAMASEQQTAGTEHESSGGPTPKVLLSELVKNLRGRVGDLGSHASCHLTKSEFRLDLPFLTLKLKIPSGEQSFLIRKELTSLNPDSTIVENISCWMKAVKEFTKDL